MKQVVRKLVLMLGCMVMIGSSFQSSAAGQGIGDLVNGKELEVVSPQHSDLVGTTASIYWNGKSDQITAYADITVSKVSNITITMYLQKQGSKVWSPVKKWTGTFNSTMGSLDKPYTLTTSGTYRVHVVFQVDGTTYTATSKEIKYLGNTYIQSMDSYE